VISTLHLLEVSYHAYLVFLTSHPNVEGHSTAFSWLPQNKSNPFLQLLTSFFFESWIYVHRKARECTKIKKQIAFIRQALNRHNELNATLGSMHLQYNAQQRKKIYSDFF